MTGKKVISLDDFREVTESFKTPPVDPPGGGGDDGGMEQRLRALETDVAVIKATMATGQDVRALEATLRGAITDQTWKFVTWVTGICVLLLAGAFFIARNVAPVPAVPTTPMPAAQPAPVSAPPAKP